LILDPSSANAKLSLTATIMSIALAIIAIIFSFVQSSEASRQNSKLIEEMQKSSQMVDTLNKVSEDLSKRNKKEIERWDMIDQSMKSTFDKLHNQLSSLAESSSGNGNEEMTTKINTVIDE